MGKGLQHTSSEPLAHSLAVAGRAPERMTVRGLPRNTCHLNTALYAEGA